MPEKPPASSRKRTRRTSRKALSLESLGVIPLPAAACPLLQKAIARETSAALKQGRMILISFPPDPWPAAKKRVAAARKASARKR